MGPEPATSVARCAPLPFRAKPPAWGRPSRNGAPLVCSPAIARLLSAGRPGMAYTHVVRGCWPDKGSGCVLQRTGLRPDMQRTGPCTRFHGQTSSAKRRARSQACQEVQRVCRAGVVARGQVAWRVPGGDGGDSPGTGRVHVVLTSVARRAGGACAGGVCDGVPTRRHATPGPRSGWVVAVGRARVGPVALTAPAGRGPRGDAPHTARDAGSARQGGTAGPGSL